MDYNNNYYKSGKDSSKNSDFIKKIKCINHNINVNGENTADINLGNDGQGTAAQKTYLSAGSSGSDGYGNEGYNKKGFDCITNNNENIVQGGTGPAGPAGPQGKPGPSQILLQNLYIVVGDGGEGQGSAVDRATCDAGDIAISGGFHSFSDDQPPYLITDRPDIPSIPPPPDYTFNTWLGYMEAEGDNFIQAYAQCFDNPPLRP